MQTNFINQHIINKIKNQLNIIDVEFGYSGFCWFDEPVIHVNYRSMTKIINRIIIPHKDIYLYSQGDYTPIKCESVRGDTLLEIYNKLNNFEFFIYRSHNGICVKSKIKKEYEKRHNLH